MIRVDVHSPVLLISFHINPSARAIFLQFTHNSFSLHSHVLLPISKYYLICCFFFLCTTTSCSYVILPQSTNPLPNHIIPHHTSRARPLSLPASCTLPPHPPLLMNFKPTLSSKSFLCGVNSVQSTTCVGCFPFLLLDLSPSNQPPQKLPRYDSFRGIYNIFPLVWDGYSSSTIHSSIRALVQTFLSHHELSPPPLTSRTYALYMVYIDVYTRVVRISLGINQVRALFSHNSHKSAFLPNFFAIIAFYMPWHVRKCVIHYQLTTCRPLSLLLPMHFTTTPS